MLGKVPEPRSGHIAGIDIPFTQALMRNKIARITIVLDARFEPAIAKELEVKGLGSETNKTKLNIDTNVGRNLNQTDSINSAISQRVSTPGVGEKELVEDCKVI